MSIIPIYSEFSSETVINSNIGQWVKRRGTVTVADSSITTGSSRNVGLLLNGCRIEGSKIEANGVLADCILDKVTIEGYGAICLDKNSIVHDSYFRPRSISMYSTKIRPGARLSGWLTFLNAVINGFADLRNENHHVTIGPIGSSARYITLHREYWPGRDFWGHRLNVGCFSGTLLQFEERINNPRLGWPQEAMEASNRNRLVQLLSEIEYKSILPMLKDKVRGWQYDPVTEEDHRVWAEWIQQRGLLDRVEIKADYIEGPLDTEEVSWVYRNVGTIL